MIKKFHTVEEAEQIILEHTPLMSSHQMGIEDLSEEVVREDLIADTPLPPYDRVMMDGIAVVLNSNTECKRTFTIQGIQKAGAPPIQLQNSDNCLEVMTGASLPIGANCIIPYEDLMIQNGQATYQGDHPLKPLKHIHTRGCDATANTVLVKAGARLLSPEWGLAASVGKANITVSKRPSIALVSTGDELVEVHEHPLPYQVRRSNIYALLASLRSEGCRDIKQFHFPDDKDLLTNGVKELLPNFHYLIFSGGISKGLFDYLPEILIEIGAKPLFHGVAQRPGKPMWFGKGPEQQMIFGLPGNPVSSLVCMHRYLIPSLRMNLGLNSIKLFAALTEDVVFAPSLTYFLPVRVNSDENGRLWAKPCQTSCSGDYSTLAGTDGFIELPAAKSEFNQGEAFPLWLWHRPRFIDKS